MDFLVGGMPRGGTTVAAKFISLHPDIFCYAGETHLVPFMYDLFRQHPCRSDKIDVVMDFLRAQFMISMVEMPRFSVSKGAHPGNLIFDERSVEVLVAEIRNLLVAGYFGDSLHRKSLEILRDILAKCDSRPILGEKTPTNVFAMAEQLDASSTKPVLVAREPFGVVRSMRGRSDPYASAFSGDTESNIGIYLDYGTAIAQCLTKNDALLIRYEEMAKDPADVLRRMFGMFGREPEDRVINFVERGKDQEIANRAPMNYKRLTLDLNHQDMSRVDMWKIASLTRDLRNSLGYSDAAMAEMGFDVPAEWPGEAVPAAILPLGGFHATEENGQRWMKQQGRLVVYLPAGASRRVGIDLWSCFPSEVVQQPGVSLKLIINGVVRSQVTVPSGQQATRLEISLSDADIQPMGTKGSYAVLTLHSSVSYSPMTTTPDSHEVRDVSFLMYGWTIN